MIGKMPSSTKLPISPGDRMPLKVSIWAICVPAFTNTMVPASMPIQLTAANVIVFMGVKPMARLITKNGNAGTRRRPNR